MRRNLWLAASLAAIASAQTDTRSLVTLTGSEASQLSTTATGTYASETGQITLARSSRLVNSDISSALSGSPLSGTSGASDSSTTATSPGSTSTITLLVGGAGLQTLSVINGTSTIYPNSTASSTSSTTSTAAQPTNTQPCNGWPEFCNRSYGNITQVAAHNAFFVVPGNAGSNQAFGVTQQLNDGIRMLTGETQYVNDTFYNCHTSCDLLNAGPLLKGYQEVAAWVRKHPYDVVTLLIVNSDFRPVEDYVPIFEQSGLLPYVYTPDLVPVRLSQWPTLSDMILRQQRVVVFMDYNANQTSVPYILDEFRHIWETPFSPQDINFPCDVQRPPQLTNQTEARDQFMYLANHNLNTAVSFAGMDFLIPNTAEINNTNAAGNGTGMLGRMDDTCANQWGRNPNWLLVDYYDRVAGSVFEVAARANGVTYNRTCCGLATAGAAGDLRAPSWSSSLLLLLAGGLALLSPVIL